jgi:hypothetical protein
MNGSRKKAWYDLANKETDVRYGKKKQRPLVNKDDWYHLFYLLYILWSNFYSSVFLLKLRGKEGIKGIAERQYGTYKAVRVKVLPIANSF